MLGNKFWLPVILSIIWLFLSITSVLAAQSDSITSEPDFAAYDPAAIQLEQLKNFIKIYNHRLNNEQLMTLCDSILTEAELTGFDPLFISSIIAAESSFHPKAVSPCAAMGLMQLTSCVVQALHIKDPFDIKENIYGGTRFLKYLKERFSDRDLILAAYNAGPTRVARLGRIPRIKETINYIQKVNRLFSLQQQEFNCALQKCLTKPPLCRANLFFQTGGNKVRPLLTENLPQPSQGAALELCEAERSNRLVFNPYSENQKSASYPSII